MDGVENLARTAEVTKQLLASVNQLIPLKKRGLSAIRTLHVETARREVRLGFDAEKAIVSRSFGVHRDLRMCEIFVAFRTTQNPACHADSSPRFTAIYAWAL